ncbi:22903_t:CDS:1, partial [Dentiscutata erythropus]
MRNSDCSSIDKAIEEHKINIHNYDEFEILESDDEKKVYLNIDKTIEEYKIKIHSYDEFEIHEEFDGKKKAYWRTLECIVALKNLNIDEKNVQESIKK